MSSARGNIVGLVSDLGNPYGTTPQGDAVHDILYVQLFGGGGALATGNFDSLNVSETLTAPFVRAAVTAFDSSQAIGSENVPVASRLSDPSTLSGVQRLCTDSALRVWNGAAYTQLIGTGASGGQNESQLWLFVQSSTRGLDTTQAGGTQVVAIASRSSDPTALSGVQRLCVDAGLRVLAAGLWQVVQGTTSLTSNLAETGVIFPVLRAWIGAVDITQPVGGQGVPLASRLASSDADVANTLEGLTTQARLALLLGDNQAVPQWVRHQGVLSVNATVLNPGNNVVLATLDSKNLANKSAFINSTVTATIKSQVSMDNVNWRDLTSYVLVANTPQFLTSTDQASVRGYRYIRLMNVNVIVGTETVELTAQA